MSAASRRLPSPIIVRDDEISWTNGVAMARGQEVNSSNELYNEELHSKKPYDYFSPENTWGAPARIPVFKNKEWIPKRPQIPTLVVEEKPPAPPALGFNQQTDRPYGQPSAPPALGFNQQQQQQQQQTMVGVGIPLPPHQHQQQQTTVGVGIPLPPQQQQPLSLDLVSSAIYLQQQLNAFRSSNGDPTVMSTFTQTPSYFVLILIVSILTLIAYIIAEIANYFEIKNNWEEYRCMPSVAPFAAFYGYNLSENMNYCISKSVKEHAPGVINPIYSGIDQVSNTVEGVFTKVSAIEQGVSGLLSGFANFILEFVNAFGLIGTRIRMMIIRIKDIFGRIYGIFMAFAFAAISALTFGENLVCNPLVAFLGIIVGYDVCCFAPDTRIAMADGTTKPITAIQIGDKLADGHTVTSLYEFDGTRTSMVLLDGIHVSGNHFLIGPDGTMISAANHPAAVPAPSLTRIWCLGTSNNRIPVVSPVSHTTHSFTDFEESEDPEVIAEVQAIAEKELNGTASIVGKSVADYSLGLDPRFLVFMRDRTWKPLSQVRIGDSLMGGGTVSGLIREVCDVQCEVPGGFVVSAAQLVFVGGQWKRAAHLFPPAEAAADTILYHLMVTNNAPFTVGGGGGGTPLTVRDYAEVTTDAMQAPYDNKLTAKVDSHSTK